jgi:hypothetical protein
MLCFFEVPKFLNPCSKQSGVQYAADLDDGQDGIHPLAGTGMVDLTLFESMQRVIMATKYVEKDESFTYWERMCATWHIIMGNHYDSANAGQTSKGVLDFLIFPLVARKLFCECESEKRGLKTPIQNGFSLAVAFPLEIIRVLIGLALLALLTVTVLPVVHALDCLVSCFAMDDDDIVDDETLAAGFRFTSL